MQNDAILTVSNLTKRYRDITAVNNLSFEVKRGEILGFLGPNGAGKTTTINMIAGLLKPDSGDIRFSGLPAGAKDKARQTVGLCPQNITIWEALTCIEQLEFIGEMYDLDRKESRKRALDLLEALGLIEKKDKLAKTLSGGMQRRLNIALALVHKPELVILDEPQAGLDPQSRIMVRDYIRSLSKKVTVLLTTHEMDEAERLSDRVAIIDHGELLVLDTLDHLLNAGNTGNILEVRIPENRKKIVENLMNSLPEKLNRSFKDDLIQIVSPELLDILPLIINILKKFAINVDDMKIRKRTLEDVFIELTGRGLRE